DQLVVASDILRFARAIVVKRAHPSESPDDIGSPELGAEVLVHDLAEVVDLLTGRQRHGRVAHEGLIRGTDQRELALEWNSKDNPPIRGLQDVSAIVLVQAP